MAFLILSRSPSSASGAARVDFSFFHAQHGEADSLQISLAVSISRDVVSGQIERRKSAMPATRPRASAAIMLGIATPSVFHQRYIGRVLRSSGDIAGRRVASSRDREPRPGRCPPLWPGDLRNDGGGVSAAGGEGGEA